MKEYRKNNKEKIKEKIKEYLKNNKEKIKENKKEYYENNKEKIKEKNKEKNKQYYENNKENKKEYYENNKEKIKEKNKEYRKNNQDKIKEYKKEYREKNKDKIKEKDKKYRENNKEKIKEYRVNNKEKIKENDKERKKCRGCKLFTTRSTTNYLCSYCNPDKKARQKTKELHLKEFLEKCNYKFIYNKACNLNTDCNRYYPDFLFDCGSYFINLECDEHSHNQYDPNCEIIRMNNIVYNLGLPVVFIRYNPDIKIKEKIKHTILKSYIDYHLNNKPSSIVMDYLFYK